MSDVDHGWPLSETALSYLRERVRGVPDFPKPGILFRDITPLLADPKALHVTLDALAQRYIGERIDAVVGIESRGFIFGAALAARLNAGFVPARKPGKLPAKVDRVAYELEYGKAELEMHEGSFAEGARVLILDDLLATGGTAAAAAKLVRNQGARVVGFGFVIELAFLPGRSVLAAASAEPAPVTSLLSYDGES